VLIVSRFSRETALSILSVGSTSAVVIGTFAGASSIAIVLATQLTLSVAVGKEHRFLARLGSSGLLALLLCAVLMVVPAIPAAIALVNSLFVGVVVLVGGVANRRWFADRKGARVARQESSLVERGSQIDDMRQKVTLLKENQAELSAKPSSMDFGKRTELSRKLDSQEAELMESAGELSAIRTALRGDSRRLRIERFRSSTVRFLTLTRAGFSSTIAVAWSVGWFGLLALTSPMWLPLEAVTTADGAVRVGYVLADESEDIVVLVESDRAVVRVRQEDVVRRDLCSLSAPSDPLVSWWSAPDYPKCEDLATP
jgi:hypothetical protein